MSKKYLIFKNDQDREETRAWFQSIIDANAYRTFPRPDYVFNALENPSSAEVLALELDSMNQVVAIFFGTVSLLQNNIIVRKIIKRGRSTGRNNEILLLTRDENKIQFLLQQIEENRVQNGHLYPFDDAVYISKPVQEIELTRLVEERIDTGRRVSGGKRKSDEKEEEETVSKKYRVSPKKKTVKPVKSLASRRKRNVPILDYELTQPLAPEIELTPVDELEEKMPQQPQFPFTQSQERTGVIQEQKTETVYNFNNNLTPSETFQETVTVPTTVLPTFRMENESKSNEEMYEKLEQNLPERQNMDGPALITEQNVEWMPPAFNREQILEDFEKKITTEQIRKLADEGITSNPQDLNTVLVDSAEHQIQIDEEYQKNIKDILININLTEQEQKQEIENRSTAYLKTTCKFLQSILGWTVKVSFVGLKLGWFLAKNAIIRPGAYVGANYVPYVFPALVSYLDIPYINWFKSLFLATSFLKYQEMCGWLLEKIKITKQSQKLKSGLCYFAQIMFCLVSAIIVEAFSAYTFGGMKDLLGVFTIIKLKVEKVYKELINQYNISAVVPTNVVQNVKMTGEASTSAGKVLSYAWSYFDKKEEKKDETKEEKPTLPTLSEGEYVTVLWKLSVSKMLDDMFVAQSAQLLLTGKATEADVETASQEYISKRNQELDLVGKVDQTTMRQKIQEKQTELQPILEAQEFNKQEIEAKQLVPSSSHKDINHFFAKSQLSEKLILNLVSSISINSLNNTVLCTELPQLFSQLEMSNSTIFNYIDIVNKMDGLIGGLYSLENYDLYRVIPMIDQLFNLPYTEEDIMNFNNKMFGLEAQVKPNYVTSPVWQQSQGAKLAQAIRSAADEISQTYANKYLSNLNSLAEYINWEGAGTVKDIVRQVQSANYKRHALYYDRMFPQKMFGFDTPFLTSVPALKGQYIYNPNAPGGIISGPLGSTLQEQIMFISAGLLAIPVGAAFLYGPYAAYKHVKSLWKDEKKEEKK
jgi:hypothetical protein